MGEGPGGYISRGSVRKTMGRYDGTAELDCSYLSVPRMRGQQLKEVSELDGWLSDGSASYIAGLCGY